MLLSIFTPTYNRGPLLKRLYESLLIQSQTDFEWIIVDDGSIDDTESVVKQFINDAKVKITYHQQANCGKHFAINKGVSLAKGNLFFTVDSDDFLPFNAIETVASYYETVKDKAEIAGVAGRRIYSSGEIVGNSNFEQLLSDSLNIRYKYKVTGDLVEVYKTQILKEFPFPEIPGEKFCPEALVWNRIAEKHQLLFFNRGIYITEYLPDGLTSKIVKIRMESPIASMLTYGELSEKNIPFLQRLKANINYWRFSFSNDYNFTKKLNKVSIFHSLLGYPIGFVMHVKDKKQNT